VQLAVKEYEKLVELGLPPSLSLLRTPPLTTPQPPTVRRLT
jgi:hypothetical protein